MQTSHSSNTHTVRVVDGGREVEPFPLFFGLSFSKRKVGR